LPPRRTPRFIHAEEFRSNIEAGQYCSFSNGVRSVDGFNGHHQFKKALNNGWHTGFSHSVRLLLLRLRTCTTLSRRRRRCIDFLEEANLVVKFYKVEPTCEIAFTAVLYCIFKIKA